MALHYFLQAGVQLILIFLSYFNFVKFLMALPAAESPLSRSPTTVCTSIINADGRDDAGNLFKAEFVLRQPREALWGIKHAQNTRK